MIQTWRLQMAHDTGSDYMVTSCPKCYIHFSCAMPGEKYPDSAKIPIKDFAVVAAEALAA